MLKLIHREHKLVILIYYEEVIIEGKLDSWLLKLAGKHIEVPVAYSTFDKLIVNAWISTIFDQVFVLLEVSVCQIAWVAEDDVIIMSKVLQ